MILGSVIEARAKCVTAQKVEHVRGILDRLPQEFGGRDREGVLHLSSHTGPIQVLSGHPQANPNKDYHTPSSTPHRDMDIHRALVLTLTLASSRQKW